MYQKLNLFFVCRPLPTSPECIDITSSPDEKKPVVKKKTYSFKSIYNDSSGEKSSGSNNLKTVPKSFVQQHDFFQSDFGDDIDDLLEEEERILNEVMSNNLCL